MIQLESDRIEREDSAKLWTFVLTILPSIFAMITESNCQMGMQVKTLSTTNKICQLTVTGIEVITDNKDMLIKEKTIAIMAVI